MIKYKFCKKTDEEFSAVIKTRVNTYFQDNQINRDANTQMILKTVLLIGWYLTPYFIMLFGNITSIPILLGLWVIMGLGKAFIGTAVMHDALHGSYFKNRTMNSLAGFSAVIVGVDELIWKIQHNVIHHTYTNIEDTDEDILPRFVFRFSKHQPRMWFHRFQHIYAPIFYCVPLLEWITTKDFVKAFEYKSLKLIKPGEFGREFGLIVFRKLLYYALFIALPLYMISIPIWITVLMIIVSHAVTGIMLAMIFQTAHVVTPTDFLKQEQEHVERSWTSHQLETTCNYGMKNKTLSWFLGGLNFQIEHHLFPDVCHVHYPEISKIVQEATEEFDLPYNSFDTFGQAIASHFELLKIMGQPDSPQTVLAT